MFVSSTLVFLVAHAASALRVTPESPCLASCGNEVRNTTSDDIVCQDSMWTDDEAGMRFKQCVECELGSTHFVAREGESDVEWGLYNLRYAFSSCIYGIPEEKQSLSTPCQVSCEPLREAVIHRLENPSGATMYDFCGMESFADNRITKCADCYALTEHEKVMANFIETIRQGCHARVVPGSEFYVVDPPKIFSTERLPVSTVSGSPNPTSTAGGGGKPGNLILLIVLPIVGFLILLLCLCIGCFFLVRHRKRKAKRDSHSGYLHERWNDTSIITPMPGGLRKLWNGEDAIDQHQMVATPHSQYIPGFYQPEYYQTASPIDVKYPPEAYLPGPSSVTPGSEQQQQMWEYQYQLQDQKQQNEWQVTQQHATVPPPPPPAQSVPILADPPPPRKSLSKKEGDND